MRIFLAILISVTAVQLQAANFYVATFTGNDASSIVPGWLTHVRGQCGSLYTDTSTGYSERLAAMCRDVMAADEYYFTSSGGQARVAKDVAGTGTSVTASCYVVATMVNNCGGSTGIGVATVGAYLSCTGTDIPINSTTCAPGPCSYLDGLHAEGGGTSGEGDLCRTEDANGDPVPAGGSCRVVRDGAGITTTGGWFGQVRFTGEVCDEGDVVSDEAPNCVSSSSGVVCISKTAKNCGKVNGESVCLDAVPSGSCTILAGGGAVCASDAPDPVDEAETPIPPDREIEFTDSEGATTTYNYYSATTVSGAAGGVSGTEGTGSSGTGDGDGDGEPIEDCEGDEACYGTLPASFGECAEDLTGCITESVTVAWGALQENVPLLDFAGDLHTSFGTPGTCPSTSITVFDETYDAMQSFCELIDDNEGLLALILQICWSIMGLRILFGQD